MRSNVFLQKTLPLLIIAGAFGFLAGTLFERNSAGPPRDSLKSRQIVQSILWGDVVLQLPAGWRGEAGKDLYWISTEDKRCFGHMILTDGVFPQEPNAAFAKASRLLHCSPAEVTYKKGQFGAQVYLFEQKAVDGSALLTAQSIVILGGEMYIQWARYPHDTEAEKRRAWEQWMIVGWLKAANLPKKSNHAPMS